jgi:hypothetical protein
MENPEQGIQNKKNMLLNSLFLSTDTLGTENFDKQHQSLKKQTHNGRKIWLPLPTYNQQKAYDFCYIGSQD